MKYISKKNYLFLAIFILAIIFSLPIFPKNAYSLDDSCYNECRLTDPARCNGSEIQICSNCDADSLFDWCGNVDCADTGRFCLNGECQGGCSDECSFGQIQCNGNWTQNCVECADGDLCLDWCNQTDCSAGGQICCLGACHNLTCLENSDCNDSDICTIDSCLNPNTCSAVCDYQDITVCIDGDGCCPASCNGATDTDCSASSCAFDFYFPCDF